MTLDYGNYGFSLIMGNAGFISSTVVLVLYGSMVNMKALMTRNASTTATLDTRKQTPWRRIG